MLQLRYLCFVGTAGYVDKFGIANRTRTGVDRSRGGRPSRQTMAALKMRFRFGSLSQAPDLEVSGSPTRVRTWMNRLTAGSLAS